MGAGALHVHRPPRRRPHARLDEPERRVLPLQRHPVRSGDAGEVRHGQQLDRARHAVPPQRGEGRLAVQRASVVRGHRAEQRRCPGSVRVHRHRRGPGQFEACQARLRPAPAPRGHLLRRQDAHRRSEDRQAVPEPLQVDRRGRYVRLQEGQRRLRLLRGAPLQGPQRHHCRHRRRRVRRGQEGQQAFRDRCDRQGCHRRRGQPGAQGHGRQGRRRERLQDRAPDAPADARPRLDGEGNLSAQLQRQHLRDERHAGESRRPEQRPLRQAGHRSGLRHRGLPRPHQ